MEYSHAIKVVKLRKTFLSIIHHIFDLRWKKEKNVLGEKFLGRTLR
jgi:hypothetical protein